MKIEESIVEFTHPRAYPSFINKEIIHRYMYKGPGLFIILKHSFVITMNKRRQTVCLTTNTVSSV